MNHLRLLSCSVAHALIITALAQLFGGMAGELLAVPGVTMTMFFEVAIMMLSESEPYYPLLNYAPHFNVIFYSASIYVVLWLYAVVKRDGELHRESLRQHNLRHPNG